MLRPLQPALESQPGHFTGALQSRTLKILLNAEVLVEFQIQRSVSILFQHKDTVPDCSHATYVGPWLQLYFICLRLLQGEFTAQCPPDSLGQLVTKYETQELSLGSGLGAAVVPCTRTQDGRGGRRLIPSPTAIRRLTTFTHREAAFLRCILTFANAFSPKKIKSKSLLCTQEVATSIQLCWISSSQTRAMDPAQVASPWFGSTSLQPARFNQAIKTESGCLDTRGAPFREWSLTDPSLKQ